MNILSIIYLLNTLQFHACASCIKILVINFFKIKTARDKQDIRTNIKYVLIL